MIARRAHTILAFLVHTKFGFRPIKQSLVILLPFLLFLPSNPTAKAAEVLWFLNAGQAAVPTPCGRDNKNPDPFPGFLLQAGPGRFPQDPFICVAVLEPDR
jgi:hypothetical protein